MPEYEELLKGAGRPRPLPPALRARLEEVLVSEATSARPLPPGARDKLEGQLKRTAKPGAAKTGTGKWGAWWPAAGIAAALVAAAAVGVPALVHRAQRPSPGTTLAAQNPKAPYRPLQAAVTTAPSQGTATSPSVPNARQPGPFGPVAAARVGRPRPVVLAVSPRSGPARGGNWVDVRGSSLKGAVAVAFGSSKSPRLVVVSGTQLRALAPAHAPGHVDVLVSGPTGVSSRSPVDRYTFEP